MKYSYLLLRLRLPLRSYDFGEIRDVPVPGDEQGVLSQVFGGVRAVRWMGWNDNTARSELENLTNKQSLTSEEQETAKKHIAAITAVDLILWERGGKQQVTKVGPLEKKLAEDLFCFVKGIEKDPLLQKATADLNPGKLAYFLQEQGGRHIASALLDKAQEIQRKTEANLKKAAQKTAQNVASEDAPVARPRSRTQPAGPKPKHPKL